MLATSLALLGLSLGQVPADEPLPPVQAGPPSVELLGGAEVGPELVAGAWALQVRPTLSLELSADFGAQLGPPLRFAGTGPLGLRAEDWDERSDLGQLLQSLSAGGTGRPVQFRAGELRSFTLGHGHLIAGYSNRVNEDYHPAGAQLIAFAGPVAMEAVASDVLAARMFAGAVRATTGDERFHAELSALHDFGLAGGVAPPLSLLQLDLDAGLFRGPLFWLNAFLGGGARVGVPDPSGGGEVGFSVDARNGALSLGGRLEARMLRGGYRPGMVGLGYEVARLAGTGFQGVPLADERLPPAFSAFFELQFAHAARGASVSGVAQVEAFTAGRTDARAWLTAELLSGWLAATGMVEVVGLGSAPRVLAQGEARVRFWPSLYAAARVGTGFRPAPGGGLERSVTAGVALGADFDLVPGARL